MINRRACLTASLLLLVTASLANEQRLPYTLNEDYKGPHQASFEKLRWKVPILMRQTMIDLSVRLGLNFEEDWSCKLGIQFVDGAPRGVENALAYVQMFQRSDGECTQVMSINLNAYDQEAFDFERVLSHELVHAMMNDQMGVPASSSLPLWLHEGLAVYGSDEGERRILQYVNQFEDEPSLAFLNGLEVRHNALDYMEDYLAIKYMKERHGINSLHNFVREITRRKGDIAGAIEYTCFEDLATFQKNAMEFAHEELKTATRNRRGKMGQPF